MIDIVWRDGEPETAQRAKNWWHRHWLKFRMGWHIINPSRVNHFQSDVPWRGFWHRDDPQYIAREVERHFR